MIHRLTILTLAALLAAGFFSGCQRGSEPHDDVAGDDPSARDSQGSAGDVKQPGTDENQPPDHAAHAQPPAHDPPAGQQSGSHVGERTKEILNAQEMIKDPNWTVVASDPQEVRGNTFVGTAYNRAAALSGTAGLEQWIQHQQAQDIDGKFPNYEALQGYIAMNGVDMPALREYHHYGYDETTGQIVILENKSEKEARHKELGLPAGQ